MERVRPRSLPAESVKRLAVDHFPIEWVDVSTIRELESYDDRNYYFQGTLAGGNEYPVPSEYVLKVLNWRESISPGLVDGFNKMMLHLRDKGYRCSYPIPVSATGERCIYSVILTEKELDAYACLDQPRLDNQRKSDVNCKQDEKRFNVRVLVYVQGQPMGKMKNPPSKRLLYATGQYVGGIDRALQDFQHQGLKDRVYLNWDLKHLLHCRNYLHIINDKEKKAMVERALDAFETYVLPNLPNFRRGVIHNDASDMNILVEEQDGSVEVTGIIDFGDCVHSYYIFELGVMLMYGMIDKDDPLEYVVPLLGGYLSCFPITEQEFDALYYVILGRFAQSVLNGEYSYSQEPSNKYLLISLAGAWRLMKLFLSVGKEYIDKKWLPLLVKTP